MTAREVFEGLLVELSKVNAPSMLLQDFNYFFNKAVSQYINKRYNIYDVNQQTTDDLRVLKSTTILKPTKLTANKAISEFQDFGAGASKLFGATYEVNLPLDYLHMLNCICIYKLKKRYKCYNKEDNVQFSAKRLTADSWSTIINDYYNRPLPERPYYYIHNVNQSIHLPTNPLTLENINDEKMTIGSTGTDIAIFPKEYSEYPETPETGQYTLFKSNVPYRNDPYGNDLYDVYIDSTRQTYICIIVQDSPRYDKCKLSKDYSKVIAIQVDEGTTIPNNQESISHPRVIDLSNIGQGYTSSVVERDAGVRYGNPSGVRMEIRYGQDDSVFELVGIFIDYIKTPQTIRLTQEQVNLTEDTSQIMEFPDYVCQEIINELVHLVMENTADPRLQTHSAVTESIASPVQQQTPQRKS